MRSVAASFWLILLAAMTVATSPLAADQTPVMADSVSATVDPDTTLFRPEEALQDFLAVSDTMDSEKRLTQTPTVALLKSMVVPGWGQVGNRSYVKALIFAGLEGLMIGSALNYKFKAADRKDEFNRAADIDERNRLYDQYLDLNGKRNRYTWFAVITIFISMFDAYVDAHLSGFPVKSDQHQLGFEAGPTESHQWTARLTLSF